VLAVLVLTPAARALCAMACAHPGAGPVPAAVVAAGAHDRSTSGPGVGAWCACAWPLAWGGAPATIAAGGVTGPSQATAQIVRATGVSTSTASTNDEAARRHRHPIDPVYERPERPLHAPAVYTAEMGSGTRERAAAVLVENHRAFLRFVERRTGSHEIAEDILQDAFVRSVDRLDEVPDEALVPWFYRVLRNAIVDRHRRGRVESAALGVLTRELAEAAAPPPEVEAEICACVRRLAGTLKPDNAAAIDAIDLRGTPVKVYAAAEGLTPSNAGVRLFRARAALRRRVVESCGTCAEHGCLDCSCGRTRRPAAANAAV
jgi:RNA polymerase sigma-70 factor (ECF subfamily)